MGTIPIYTPNQACVVSLFYRHGSLTILSAAITLQRCLLPFWSYWGSTSTTFEHVQSFLSLPVLIPQQIFIHFILSCISLTPLNGKTLGLFLPTSLACIKWSQPVYYLFWVNMLSQQSTSQKGS